MATNGAIADQMKRLAHAFPNRELTDVFVEELETLIAAYDNDVLKAAVTRIIRTKTFFPAISELAEALRAEQELHDNRKRAAEVDRPFGDMTKEEAALFIIEKEEMSGPTCPVCDGAYFLVLSDNEWLPLRYYRSLFPNVSLDELRERMRVATMRKCDACRGGYVPLSVERQNEIRAEFGLPPIVALPATTETTEKARASR